MSKAIVIQKDGVDQQISVDRLSTPKVGGGRELWIPEDETTTGSITVTKRGTVIASDLGLYGFHEAIIDVKSVTGKKGGKTYTVSVDTDGYLEYTEDTQAGIPVRIEVVTPPTNPYGIYQDGQTIEKTGMVVKAYDQNDIEWGTVPLGEITLFPEEAIYDEIEDKANNGIATLDDESIEYGTTVMYQYFENENKYIYESTGDCYYVYMGNQDVILAFKFGATEPTGTITTVYPDGHQTSRKWVRTSSRSGTYTYNGVKKSFSYYSYSPPGASHANRECSLQRCPSDMQYTVVAMILFEGTRTPEEPGSRQDIEVIWPRPDDHEELTTTFKIRVAPGYYDENEA